MPLIINRVKLPTISAPRRFAFAVHSGLTSPVTRDAQENVENEEQIRRGGQNVEQLSSCGTRKTDSSDNEACSEERANTRSSEVWARLVIPGVGRDGLDEDSGVSQNRTKNNDVVAFIFARDYNTCIENANGHDAFNTMSVLARLREELRV